MTIEYHNIYHNGIFQDQILSKISLLCIISKSFLCYCLNAQWTVGSINVQSTIVSPLNPIFHGFVTSVVGEFCSKSSVVIHESLPQKMPSLR